VQKLNANDYTTSMSGLKFKVAHKRADTERWSAAEKTQRKRMIEFLKDVIQDLEQQQAAQEQAVAKPARKSQAKSAGKAAAKSTTQAKAKAKRTRKSPAKSTRSAPSRRRGAVPKSMTKPARRRGRRTA
jgi:uncharacterized membrane protein